jgi:glucose/arabinose dehydrogenase
MKRRHIHRLARPAVLIWLVLLLAVVITGCTAALGGSEPAAPVGGSLVIDLVELENGFSSPVEISSTGNEGDNRLFIVEQAGYIRILNPDGSVVPAPFLDIEVRVGSGGDEQGLLGLAFHPDYENNGYFYVNYTNTNGDTRISRFSMTVDPNVADPNSELQLLPIDQPESNHNGGELNFGPDGYLYIAMGDGGSGGDPWNNAQTASTLLGKMLRIDVDNGSLYAIPPDNPYVDDPNVLDEIWAFGLRNPWRFSFDRSTGDMWIGDVGQNAWEEVDMEPAGSPGGLNWGWRCYEGDHAYNTNGCGPMGNYDFPVHEYAQGSSHCAVTGGYVYRGNQYPAMYGHYLFADYCSGRFWSLSPNDNDWLLIDLGVQMPNLFSTTTFGERSDGELFVANRTTGGILHVVAVDGATPTPSLTPSPTLTPSVTPTPSATPTIGPTATATETPTPTPTATKNPLLTERSYLPAVLSNTP